LATTPVYGWDYQSLSDPPNGATLGQNLALDAEATVAALDARLVLAEADVALRYRSTQVVSSAVAAVTFSSIPTTLRKLEIVWTARSTTAAVAANLRLRVNNNSGALYSSNFIQQNNTTITGNIQSATTFWQAGVIAGATAAANNFGGGTVTIAAWNAPHANLNHTHHSHFYESAPNSWFESGGGLFFAAAPYNRLDFFCDAGNLDVNSQFLVLGWI
jgi:hypothetical protein